MAVAVRMKPVTVYFQELKYLMFQEMARQKGAKAAELVRDAMDEYIENHSLHHGTVSEWKPVSLGGIKAGAADWLTKDFQDEMLGSAF